MINEKPDDIEAANFSMSATEALAFGQAGRSVHAITTDEKGVKDIIDIVGDDLACEDSLAIEDVDNAVLEAEMSGRGGSLTATMRIDGVVWSGLSDEVVKFLDGPAKNAKNIDVIISSPGGSVSAGLKIYQELREHPANIHTIARGSVASMGTVIMMAGDKRSIREGTEWMVHEVSPKEREIKGYLERIQLANKTIRGIYETAGVNPSLVAEAFDSGKDTWLGAEDAAKHGFADHVISDPKRTTKTVPVKAQVSSDAMWSFDQESLKVFGELCARANTGAYAITPANTGDKTVTFEEWLKAAGFDILTLSAQQKSSLEATFKGQLPSDPVPSAIVAAAVAPAAVEPVAEAPSRAEQLTKQLAIEKICGSFKELAIEMITALESGQNVNLDMLKMQVELRQLKEAQVAPAPAADFGAGPTPFVQTRSTPDNIVEDAHIAALAMEFGATSDSLLDPFKGLDIQERAELQASGIKPLSDEAISYAAREGLGQPQQTAEYCAKKDGKSWNHREPSGSFSTMTYPVIITKGCDYAMLANRKWMESNHQKFTREIRVNDLKKHNYFRADGFGRWQQIQACGTIKAGEFDAELAYEVQAGGVGQLITLCETHLINNDFGQVQAYVNMFTRYGLEAPSWSVWDDVRKAIFQNEDGTICKFDFSNGVELLKAMWKCFCRKQKARELNVKQDDCEDFSPPVMGDKPVLLVNDCDAIEWAQLLSGRPEICGGANGDKQTVHLSNEFASRFSAVCESPYVPEGSAAIVPAAGENAAFWVAYLRGVKRPRIRIGEAPANKLGVTLQGVFYYGSGVGETNRLCTVKDANEDLNIECPAPLSPLTASVQAANKAQAKKDKES